MSWFDAALQWVASLFAPTSTPDSTKVAQIQAAAVKACGFLPMAESVAALLAQGNPAVATVTGVANSICAVVKSRPTAQPVSGLMESEAGTPTPPTWGTLNGVPIQGVFVR